MMTGKDEFGEIARKLGFGLDFFQSLEYMETFLQEYSKIPAAFYKGLIENGIPDNAAMAMACVYVKEWAKTTLGGGNADAGE